MISVWWGINLKKKREKLGILYKYWDWGIYLGGTLGFRLRCDVHTYTHI